MSQSWLQGFTLLWVEYNKALFYICLFFKIIPLESYGTNT